jgi:hypothetical protein
MEHERDRAAHIECLGHGGTGQNLLRLTQVADPRLGDQELDGTAKEGAVLAHRRAHRAPALHRLLRGLPVGGEMVFAAQVVVVHPRRMRFRRVNDRLHRRDLRGSPRGRFRHRRARF